jgi:probable phosphoglycerate mutase
MKLYFVRHGQTKYNALQVHQPENAELSKLGIKQAEILAKRLSKIQIDIIYSSPIKRAKQTAKIINKTLKKKIVYSDFLKERKGPSEFIGKTIDDPEVIQINKIRNVHENDFLWHYSDEENFIEFKERVKKFFNVLGKTKKENILVVTHGGPIRMMIFLMMGNKFMPESFYKFSDLFKLSNTGITLCERDKKGIWSVQSFNDCAHLG